jgi:methionyl-tRNA synthetase
MRRFAPNDALAAIWELVAAANKYVGDVEPWTLAKRVKTGDTAAEARLATALYNLAEALRLIAYYVAPFLPSVAEGIAAQLGIALEERPVWAEVTRWGQLPAGTRTQPGAVLFPKLEAPAETPE